MQPELRYDQRGSEPATSTAENVIDSPPPIADDQQSGLWEIQIPFAAAAIPAITFWLLGFVNRWFVIKGNEPPGWLFSLTIWLELIGMVAMAVVLLIRYDIASEQLSSRTDGKPALWRRLTLVLALGMLLVFDTTVNLAAAFPGARVLLVLGIPAFLLYLALCRLSLTGLGNAGQLVDSAKR